MNFHYLTKDEINIIVNIDKESNKTPWSLHDYEESFKNPHHYFVGYSINNKLIGICAYSLVIDEAEILQIVIEKESQGNGYGYQLLNHVCNLVIAQKATQIFLEVMVGNTNAINLYHKLGFNIIGKRKNYYRVEGKSIDAILMAKTLIGFDLS
ncbi:MAG: ribosomal protein S18-alanine N-acetyltransferase [Burkholderiales bacterium]|nr:ribosomal protein S18-alanine N-acetyltransferase [Burkholderiales bacterium]